MEYWNLEMFRIKFSNSSTVDPHFDRSHGYFKKVENKERA